MVAKRNTIKHKMYERRYLSSYFLHSHHHYPGICSHMNPKAVPVALCSGGGVHVFESEIIIIHILSNYFIHHIDHDLYLRTRFRSIHTESTFFCSVTPLVMVMGVLCDYTELEEEWKVLKKLEIVPCVMQFHTANTKSPAPTCTYLLLHHLRISPCCASLFNPSMHQ